MHSLCAKALCVWIDYQMWEEGAAGSVPRSAMEKERPWVVCEHRMMRADVYADLTTCQKLG